MSERFGFTVSRVTDYAEPTHKEAQRAWYALPEDQRGEFPYAPLTEDEWNVSLPHQCDQWDIVNAREYRGDQSWQVAVDALTAFLAEGQAALESLLRREEVEE
jgi:hypothetical protein